MHVRYRENETSAGFVRVLLGYFSVLTESGLLALGVCYTAGIFVFLSWPRRIRITDKLREEHT
jgi:hypothetical protein